MKRKLIISLLFLAAIFAVLFFTRPSKDKHVEVISQNITEAINETASLDGAMEYAREFGLEGLLTQGIKVSLKAGLKFEDYYILTITKIPLPNGEEVAGVGIAGHIFTADKEELRKSIETYLP